MKGRNGGVLAEEDDISKKWEASLEQSTNMKSERIENPA